jgi:Protein of unknown function (DUF1552)
MILLPKKPLPRRTFLRGAGVCLGVPFLEAMQPWRANAQAVRSKHFIGMFYPMGLHRSVWMPKDGVMSAANTSACLMDFGGFAKEGIWPAAGSVYNDVAAISGIDHSQVAIDIHEPSQSLSAHKGVGSATSVPGAATLDQVLADRIGGDTPYRSISLAGVDWDDITQAYVSFRNGGQPSFTYRDPLQFFQQVFSAVGGGAGAAALAAARQASILDYVRDEANLLNQRVGAEDKRRVDRYLTAVSELEKQLNALPTGAACIAPATPPATSQNDFHIKSKLFLEMGVLAMTCGLTRVVTMQYADCWSVNYSDYNLGEGIYGASYYSDHHLSHKLGADAPQADLAAYTSEQQREIAQRRVNATGRFKARRFAFLVELLKSYPSEGGTLLDDSMAMFFAENADGASHSRQNMNYLLAGHVGGFKTGRALSVSGNTGALHASILGYYGIDVSNYGNPMGNRIAGL